MRKVLPFIMACVVVACGTNSVVGPTSQEGTTQAVTSVTPSTLPAAVPPASEAAEWEGSIGSFASWSVKNLTKSAQGYTAYYTSFDDQKTRLGSRSGRVQPNDVFSGTFDKTCVQVDVEHEGGGLFLSGYINHLGAVVNQYGLDIAKCTPKPPCTKSFTGEFVVTYLSDSGDGYKIKDDGLAWLTVNLKKGTQDTRFAHAVDGSNLCLYWGSEKIGCSVASCSDTKKTWHGTVGFKCTEVCK